MTPKTFSAILLAAHICFANGQDINVYPVLTIEGKDYTNARVGSVNSTDAFVYHSGGVKKVPLTNLPPDLQKQHPYDSEKAARVHAEEQAQKKLKADQVRARAATIQKKLDDELLIISYDRFYKTTRFSTKEARLDPPSCKIKFWTFVEDGKELPETFSLHLVSGSRDWRFLKFRDCVILCDNRPVSLGDLEHDGDVSGEYVKEQLSASLSPKLFNRLCDAQKLQMRVGAFDFGLEDCVAGMRALRNRFPKLFEEKQIEASTKPAR